MGTIKTKFSFGQKVWSIQGNKIQEFEISKIQFVQAYKGNEKKEMYTQTLYGLGWDFVDDYQDVLFPNVVENVIFKSKSELIKNM